MDLRSSTGLEAVFPHPPPLTRYLFLYFSLSHAHTLSLHVCVSLPGRREMASRSLTASGAVCPPFLSGSLCRLALYGSLSNNLSVPLSLCLYAFLSHP